MELTIDQALQQAVEAHRNGEVQDADLLYRAILKVQPKHPDANHNLGILILSLNKPESALPLFKTALEANPRQGQFWLSYINALIKEKQFHTARNILSQGKKMGLTGGEVDDLELQIAQLDVYLPANEPKPDKRSIAIELRELGKYKEAEEWLKKYLDEKPDDTEGWCLLSHVYLLDKRDLDAEVALAKAISVNPNLPLVYLNQARLLLNKSKPIEALEAAKIAYERSRADPESCLVLAACLGANQIDQDALPLIESAIIARPNYAEAFANRALVQLRAKNITSAVSDLEKALSIKPHLVQLWGLLGFLRYQSKDLLGAIEALKKAHALEPFNENYMTDLGEFLRQDKQYAESISILEKAKKLAPANVNAWTTVGLAYQQYGKIENAKLAYQKAFAINPKSAEIANALGVIAKETGDFATALQYFEQVINIKPDLAEAHSNLGSTLKEVGKLVEATLSYRVAISIKPEFAGAHINLGNTLKELGRLEEAETSYKKAILIKPDIAEAHYNLGITLHELGRLDEAESSYKKAITVNPELAVAHYNLGITLKELERQGEALVAVIKSIEIKPTFAAKDLFVEITKNIDIKSWDQQLADFVITAILEPWSRPSSLMPFACKLLKVDTELVNYLNQLTDYSSQAGCETKFLNLFSTKKSNASGLLQAMLSSSPIPDAEIERLLTILRNHLLKVVQYETLNKAEISEVIPLYCSLAQQCFINEYVYFQTSEEIDISHQLRGNLIQALEGGDSVSANLVIAVACYYPLHSIVGAEKLLRQKWPDDVISVLRLQIQEPFEELNLRKSIPVLTSIDNHVSLAVQSQYEENPYPRWVRLPKESNEKLLNSYIQSKFPLSSFKPLSDDLNPEILIAGCGTGQHPIGTSQKIKGAKITAVDLSVSSLAYAKRKTAKLEIKSIDYKQADLLKLAILNRNFDVVESSGVLHHLENPFEGLKVLLSLLRPNGLMRLGFYSELGRRSIVRARNLISLSGIGASSQEIRNYRKNVLDLNDSEDLVFTCSPDFYSTSACRDLLFHVHEHRMNLKMLSDYFKDHNLNFLGFEIDNSVIRSYKNRFSNDATATNLDQWDVYENENPNTFAGMYQFWIQKSNNS